MTVVSVKRLELAFAPHRWPFADERRAEIDAHFIACRRDKPALWNGRILLLRQWEFGDDVFRGTFFDTDFASFLAWRDWGAPDGSVKNCFAQGALQAADGTFLLGVMGPHTANAGRIYFPSGTPDPSDVSVGQVHMQDSVLRELAEETGLQADDVIVEPGWYAVPLGPRIALMKILRSPEASALLRLRIIEYLGRQETPELSDIRLVGGRADLDPLMPEFIAVFLDHVWRTC